MEALAERRRPKSSGNRRAVALPLTPVRGNEGVETGVPSLGHMGGEQRAGRCCRTYRG